MSAVRHVVSIVGAGPGDPDLLTRRAFTRIAEADLVLRDLLVPDALLEATGTRADIVDVGRRCGAAESQQVRQARINAAMQAGWAEGRRVVRLKSGDPLVFGRAAEEARFLAAHDIPFEFVPGITAGLAAASLAQVPLTERHRASAVLFCAGQLADGDSAPVAEWAGLLRGGTTLVLYMGLRALNALAPRLRVLLPDVGVEVTAVSQVSLPGQLRVSAPLGEIEDVLAKAALPQPVVFILGPA
ncbi:Uroporphyrinogen-III methyltransferase [Rhodovastum atsumiense]|uniref:uroporphyrinogen-III C-methyltransferase n=1 Tax=Rhodovastum atsumiense TaxID=504468 RepID=A0A5M6IWX0_9PROT|nr:uroporphyrinogen-III C-methyltransferase [Rhodovastum atsumiense]KAA5612830.1 uroporphyrinogen-III C-methyltransferase [Rhodovastum atsumiense]CAH2601105.1 Uroporphyrinogen-III methyltransferase [Rhodovastum atsumiense]